MAKCIYIKNNKEYSYSELVSELKKSKDLDSNFDVLYNVTTLSDLDKIVEKIKDLKDKNKIEFKSLSDKVSNTGDDISIERKESRMGVMDFIDDPRFKKADDTRFLPQMSDEDFKKNRSLILLTEYNLDKDEADKLVEAEFPKWKQQRNDGIIIHYILKFSNIDSITALKSKLNDLKTFIPDADLTERILMFLDDDNLMKQLFTISLSIAKTRPKGSKVIQTIPISSEATLLDGSKVTVVDSIDQIVIDSAGYIKVYKYKVTEENPTNWNESNSPKVEKYRYELAFIRAMLENSKNFTKNQLRKISLNLFAVQVKYQKELGTDDKLLIKEIVSNPSDLQMDISSDGSAKMSRHLEAARQFIQPKIEIGNIDEAVRKANAHMERVWTGKNIKVEATVKSVDQWISDNIDKNIIKLEATPGTYNEIHWKVLFPGKRTIFIKEETDPEHNVEMHEAISKCLDEVEERNDTIINSLQRGIVQATQSGYIDSREFKGFKGSAANIKSMLDPYFVHETDANGNKIFTWEFVQDSILNDYGILLFRNKKTLQIDVVTLTNLNLTSKIKFKYGRANLAGSYMSDINSKQLPSTWGNIYAMKTLILLNYVIPNIKGKLGNLKVVTTFDNGKSLTFNIAEVISKYYNPLMKIVEQNTSEGAFENNFSKSDFVDSYEALLNELKSIVKANKTINTSIENFEDQVSYLESLNGDGAKISALIDLAKSIYDLFDYYMSADKMAENYYNRHIGESNNHYTIELLIKISNVINQLRKDTIGPPLKIGKLSRMFIPTSAIPNNHFKIVARYWNETSQRINNEAYDIGLEINKITLELYKDAGYSQMQNKFIGNQLSVFKNMYESGTSMMFKNPYDMNNSLLSYERKFLKKALMIFAKYRYINTGKNFSYSLKDVDSTNYKEFVEKNSKWYFCVPLRKASSSSDLQSGYAFKDSADKISMMLQNPKLWARRFLDDKALDVYIKEHKADSDVTILSVRNYFSYGEPDISSQTYNDDLRQENLKNHSDSRFYEHNIENLLRDFTFESVRALNMNKMLFACKLILTQLTLSGRINNNLKDFESEIKFILDFLKVNVFNIPLMESSELAIASFVLPMRKFVSRALTAANFAGGIRDGFEGFGQIMARAVTKYGGTNIAAGDVLRAYSIVTREMMTKLPLASLVSLLCIKYRMSNIDVSNVAEGMKTERGIFNFDNMMYATLRKPDFLNRMTLFVAKCIHDGTWDAFSLDNEGLLKYDWKKDKRFDLLAKNDKSNLDAFNKLKGMYFSLIRIWNEEHPNNQVLYTDDLPMPYTEKEMDTMHALSDNIWGAYDKSKKSLGEHSLLMMTYGMFMTWMNGQIKNYYSPLQEAQDRVLFVHMRNNNGLLLYYNDDGSFTTEDTGKPVWSQEPIWVHGILQTLGQIYGVIKDGGSWDEVFGTKENPSEINRENMKKLATDITMTLIYLTLIRAVLQALRDEQKEITDPHDVITNGICEVLYKGMYNSWDGFAGPLNLIQYLGNLTNPPIYTEGIGITKDLFKVVIGDMTILSFGSRHFAPIRSFRETIKDNEKE